MKNLAIIGAGGHAKVVCEIAELNGWKNIVLFDEKWPELDSLEHWEIKGNFDSFSENVSNFDACFIAIGDNKMRKKVTRLVSTLGVTMVNLVHPSSVISKYVKLGNGCVIMAAAVINPFSIIGDGVIVNTGATIDHDCILQDFAHVSPGVNLAGEVTCAEGSWVGIGSSIKQSVKIGAFSVVGAGSVVISDVSENTTVVGAPAKSI